MVHLLDERVEIGAGRHLLQQFAGESLGRWIVSGNVVGQFFGGVVEKLLVQDLRHCPLVEGLRKRLNALDTLGFLVENLLHSQFLYVYMLYVI